MSLQVFLQLFLVFSYIFVFYKNFKIFHFYKLVYMYTFICHACKVVKTLIFTYSLLQIYKNMNLLKNFAKRAIQLIWE